jgi:p-aminobenzoyl-glutamate transporter AbgT
VIFLLYYITRSYKNHSRFSIQLYYNDNANWYFSFASSAVIAPFRMSETTDMRSASSKISTSTSRA